MKKKYERIIEYIEEQRTNQDLKQGQRLPSIRALANQFSCNKSTVIRAYQELELNHKIYSIPKGGYYLVEQMSPQVPLTEAVDFSELTADPKLLPYKEFTHCINRAVEQYKESMFTYTQPQGLVSLRETLEKHFSNYQVFCKKEDIFITTGAQQALYILAKMPFPNGKKYILVEQPTYSLMRKIVELSGGHLKEIKRSTSGIDFAELERIFKEENIKFFYTMSRFHNPLGTCFSDKEKKTIACLAKQYDVYVVEDDYLVDIETNKKRLPIYYYRMSEHIIYVKSFSKAFMPGIRIGATVLGYQFHKEFLLQKRCVDLATSILSQGALEIFINSQMFQKHVSKVRHQYRKKILVCKQSFRPITEMEVWIPETGFFIWIQFSPKIDGEVLRKRLEKKNVKIAPIDKHSLPLCIAKLSEEQIKVGIRILCDEVEALL